MSIFGTPQESHQHSLETLNTLQEYDEFMESIKTLADLGCGSGLDLKWWATRTTREDNPQPLNIKCTGIDINESLPIARNYNNIVYQKTNFEDLDNLSQKNQFDVLWSHDSFQYAINPVQTLSNWWNMATNGAMLILIVPQTTNIHQHKLAFTQESGSYYHHTVVSLIHQLAVSGWDCHSGFFLKRPQDPWLHAVVYKSVLGPQDPRTTSWHKLSELGLLPESAERSIYARDDLHQQDLVLPWLDGSLTDFLQL